MKVRDEIMEAFKSILPSTKIIGEGEDGFAGMFRLHGIGFKFIASWGRGWDHVSVSTSFRCPTWEEMVLVKAIFFEPEECVMQLHPPQSVYVNDHPYCLHLFKPQNAEIPMPPLGLV